MMHLPRAAASVVLVWTGFTSTSAAPRAQPPRDALRIVVIEGEDAVNVVQQKTAVAPVVEVRDRNDQPVAGAVVRFAIRSGKATFGGPRTLSVTTNGAGRAAVATLTPTGSGALQISATAAFQGQTAAVMITQTNVMTAAAASAASGAGGAGAGAAGGGAGGGGGLSATTIGIVGGAVAGGVVIAEKALGNDTDNPFSGTWVRTFTFTDPRVSGSLATLTFVLTQTGNVISGDVTIALGPPGSGTDVRPVSGTVSSTSPRLTIDNPIRSNVLSDRFGQPYGLCTERYALDPSSDGNKLSGTNTLIPDARCPTVSGTGQVTLDRK